jgi:divalent metal cation (Fe/Co/Zn/Cd) transporter
MTEYAKKHDTVLGVHDIVIHNYGPGRCFASMHVEVDGKKDIYDTHDVIDNIERDLSEMYGIHCVVHLDPIVVDNELVCDLREKVASIVREYDERLTMHDFRMVVGPTHSNLIFDLLVPYEYDTSVTEIKEELDKQIKEIDNNYYAVITIDKG